MLREEQKSFGPRVARSFASRMLTLHNPLMTFIRMKNKVATRILQPGTIALVLALEKSAVVVSPILHCKGKTAILLISSTKGIPIFHLKF